MLAERPVLQNSWVEPARPPQPVANTDPRAGMQLTPELYVEPVTTSEPAPVEIDPALEERFAKFASGAVSSANDEPVRNTDALLSAARDSSPVVAQAEPAVEAVAEAAAVPHALVDSFLEAHFAGQSPAGMRACGRRRRLQILPSRRYRPGYARIRRRQRSRSWICRQSTCPRRMTTRTCVDRVVRVAAARQTTASSALRARMRSIPCSTTAARAVSEPSGVSPDVEATVILPTSVALSAQPSPVADTSVISVPAAVAPAVVAAPVAAAAPAAVAPSTSAPVLERLPEPAKIRIRAEQPAAPVVAQTVAEPGS